MDPLITTEELVGQKLRFIRTKQGFSLRALADRSGLNINTLSSIENGKTSPSVSTLQQLAQTLGISIADFFDIGLKEKQIIFTSGADSPKVVFGSTTIQNMGKGLAGASVQPFVITFQQHNGSGDQEVSHSGHEFVYCLNGRIHYRINQDRYTLDAGDSLLFEAHLPHSWENEEEEPAKILLIIFPSDNREDLGGKHFSINTIKRDINSVTIPQKKPGSLAGN